MKAALFTLFAPGYVQDTIVPRLGARGIHVARVMEPRDAERTRIVEDLVLFMHEFGPHANDKIVREAAKSQGKAFKYLSRKAGNWPADLRDDADVPAPESGQAETTLLPPERLDAALRALVSLRDDAGQTYDAIAPQLRNFWRAGEVPPLDGKALRRLMETLRERGEPKWFVAWRPAPPIERSPASTGRAPMDDGDAELLTMFEAECERLQGELGQGHTTLTEVQKELADEVKWRREFAEPRLDDLTKELAATLDEAKLWKGEYEKLHERYVGELDILQKSINETRERVLVVDRARQSAEAEADELRKIANTYRLERDGDVARAHEQSSGRIADLTTEVRDLQDLVRIRDEQIENLQIGAPRSVSPTTTNGLGKMLAAVRPLVPAILSAEEALDRLTAYAAKEGA
jgi:hypothetical protein